eukprot:SAG11_NODE_659_length_7895_cov_18.189969_13_plen_135_part_00
MESAPTPAAPPTKPNPLTHATAASTATSPRLSQERRGSHTLTHAVSGETGVLAPVRVFAEDFQSHTSNGAPASPAAGVSTGKRPRVKTEALTGVRGLAAFHVAAGHMFSFSTLRVDLIGGAAMPFFYLLSGARP